MRVFKFQAELTAGGCIEVDWQPRADDAGGNHSLGVVPMVPLENKPSLLDGGVSPTCAARSRCRTRSTSSART